MRPHIGHSTPMAKRHDVEQWACEGSCDQYNMRYQWEQGKDFKSFPSILHHFFGICITVNLVLHFTNRNHIWSLLFPSWTLHIFEWLVWQYPNGLLSYIKVLVGWPFSLDNLLGSQCILYWLLSRIIQYHRINSITRCLAFIDYVPVFFTPCMFTFMFLSMSCFILKEVWPSTKISWAHGT